MDFSYGFLFKIYSCMFRPTPFWINFYVLCKVWIEVHLFAPGYPIVPTTPVGITVLFLLMWLCTFAKNQFSIYTCVCIYFLYLFSDFLFCSVDLFVYSMIIVHYIGSCRFIMLWNYTVLTLQLCSFSFILLF